MKQHTVTVYSNPGCQPCRATRKKLTSLGIDYDEVSLADVPAVAATFIEEGYTSAPIVSVVDYRGAVVDTWSGYSPDKLKALANNGD
ncbi:glutaredoxin [Corynebacterium phage EmiRose]|uniref:Glutaredoxin n=1 Tax=Corynebacterium phage EmiRose TaxID=2565372 RepID=A0A649VNY8_9CAUD|nr:glutaredoxin [Corynebacterium phage EmiRose]QGJ94177.1 glutaredoxin [Corynebacterium phage EmiRose]